MRATHFATYQGFRRNADKRKSGSDPQQTSCCSRLCIVDGRTQPIAKRDRCSSAVWSCAGREVRREVEFCSSAGAPKNPGRAWLSRQALRSRTSIHDLGHVRRMRRSIAPNGRSFRAWQEFQPHAVARTHRDLDLSFEGHRVIRHCHVKPSGQGGQDHLCLPQRKAHAYADVLPPAKGQVLIPMMSRRFLIGESVGRSRSLAALGPQGS